jgi:two-component system, response regulator RegA
MMARRTREGDDKASLLLVDDDATLCDTLGRALAKRGFEVKTALTVESASKLANESPPEYAVVDLRLPDKPGLELVSTLIGLDPHTRIVVLTGYGNIATAIEAIKLGATYYLCKPVDVNDIIAAFRHNAADDETAANEKPMSIKRMEWERIWQVLREHKGNVSQAARALSMHRRTLQRKLAKRPVKS